MFKNSIQALLLDNGITLTNIEKEHLLNHKHEEEILKKLDDTFAGLDQQRANGLEDLKTLQTVKDDAAQREKLRLTNKYGADHPRVKKIADRLNYNQGLKKRWMLKSKEPKSPSRNLM